MDVKSMLTANFLLGVAGGIEYVKLKQATRHPRESAEKALRHILSYAQDTVFGREHRFSYILEADHADELFRRYRSCVPPRQYEAFRPYIERQKTGETDVLFPGKPQLYTTTSGTTDKPKWLPISADYLEEVNGKMSRLWFYEFTRNRPKVFSGKELSVIGKVIEGYAPDGTICGSVSGFTHRDAPGFLQHCACVPFCVYGIEDYDSRYYVLMRLSIEQDLTLLITANPSTIVELQNNAVKYLDEYIEDIEKGTLTDKVRIEPEIRAELEAGLKPNPARAAELRALKAKYGILYPKHYWPNFQILTTWKCANTKIYIDKFRESFPPRTLHQEFGYFASECRFGLVLDDTDNTVLFPHLHYYEFIAEEDLCNPDPTFLDVFQLVEGKRYCPFITTLSGLYRYNMNDLVEAGPSFGQTPTIHMIQKTGGIVSITGEKIHESQFTQAVHAVADETGRKLEFFIGCADLHLAGYRFFYEFAEEITPEELAAFNAKVDARLRVINTEYDGKRKSLRLPEPLPQRLAGQSFQKYKEACLVEGRRDGGQFKIPSLTQDAGILAKFTALTLS